MLDPRLAMTAPRTDSAEHTHRKEIRMTRAIWSSVSGLDNHQTWMDVLGNNISNVNTAGYKDSRFEFEDILSESIRGAAPPAQGGVGGTNPEQVGLGVNSGS